MGSSREALMISKSGTGKIKLCEPRYLLLEKCMEVVASLVFKIRRMMIVKQLDRYRSTHPKGNENDVPVHIVSSNILVSILFLS